MQKTSALEIFRRKFLYVDIYKCLVKTQFTICLILQHQKYIRIASFFDIQKYFSAPKIFENPLKTRFSIRNILLQFVSGVFWIVFVIRKTDFYWIIKGYWYTNIYLTSPINNNQFLS